ncbi:Tat (twin-arginine translocation) pathway signal sequence [Salinigranum rubrum]|uniref:Tat (Twin-arginine translocation) pathway signal sequence n=1 Tax=Salinigranum rubrum TaxID=755307 RepID=A0A2I8VI79_9EURY|nr:gluconate 2-dehydrogenase subunit 3 family protein [Salinigranum rubrum]AUV81646.1 Tat (twin-arginine translocation) pathway signal sequence [Salinigranum rubrum]
MRLSRRDALAVLAGLGAAGGGAALGVIGTHDAPVAGDGRPVDGEDEREDEDALSVLVAAAEVLYPSDVDGHRAFVETYVAGRRRTDPDHYAGVVSAARELDAVARDWHDTAFATLAPETRDRLLRDLGVDVADPDPAGNVSDRLRFFVVNDLLYAFYTSPTGGELVGTENPTGYPGGLESYQHGPGAVDDG